MAELPSGTVTFLLTDVEGSTVLWERDPEAMRRALTRHDAILAAGVERHGGTVVKSRGEGDSVFAVFSLASDAVAAATDLQRALLREPWPTPEPLRVRMALHTGEAELRDGDYYGAAVNRCARLREVGHGGQILLSEATHDLVRDALLVGGNLIDLGEHRLRDLTRPERISQVIAPDLPGSFPPLRSRDTRSNNLPVDPTPLIGRERELEITRGQLLRDEVRLLTLTGPGGAGKTRLAVAVAATLVEHFQDGVFFVDLAPISDPNLVPGAIAHVLAVREVGGQPLIDTLKGSLQDRGALLLLDNFEQILSAADLVGDLLLACPKLKLLVTSRAVLHLRGEKEFAVPPLALPDPTRPVSAEALAQCSAIALFIQRARDVNPDFALTEENALAIAEICRRLDGLPLAIELAAGRIKLFSPDALLRRLENRLPLLTGGARDLPARQQTLRGTIDWSYDLLTPEEQALFCRLAVFVGGCTLEAAEWVSGVGWQVTGNGASPPSSPDTRHPTPDTLDGVASLVDRSLLRQTAGADGEPRFWMLETIREYGLEQIEARGEAAEIRSRHAEYYLAFAERARMDLAGPNQAEWLDRLETEHGNLRLALRWLTDTGQVETGLRLGASLSRFWAVRGYLTEGRKSLSELLALPGASAQTSLRARTLNELGGLARAQGDYAAAQAHYEESLSIRRELDDKPGITTSLTNLGILRRLQGDFGGARSMFEEGLSIGQGLVDENLLALLLNNLGLVALAQDDHAAASAFFENSLAILRELGDKGGIALCLNHLGLIAYSLGDYAEAHALHRESLALKRELGDKRGIAHSLEALAVLELTASRAERAARLFGAAEMLRETIGAPRTPGDRSEHHQAVEMTRTSLGDEQFSVAWAEGRAMPLEQAIAYALEGVPST